MPSAFVSAQVLRDGVVIRWNHQSGERMAKAYFGGWDRRAAAEFVVERLNRRVARGLIADETDVDDLLRKAISAQLCTQVAFQ